MIGANRVGTILKEGLGRRYDLDPNPSAEDIRAVVRELQAEGICGRRIAEQRLGPFLIASPDHGQRELQLLEEIIAEEYADTDRCVATRGPDCSRLNGGCKYA